MHYTVARGFSLIELLVVIAVLALLASISLTVFSSYRGQQQFTQGVENVRSAFTEAQTRTLSSESAMMFGVHLDSAFVAVFSGDTYNATADDTRTYTLGTNVTITDITLADAGTDIVFERLTGMPSTTGTFTIEHSSTNNSVTLSITETGNLDVQ